MRVSVVLLALAVAGCASASNAGGHASAAAPRYSPALVSVQVQVPSRTMEAGSSMLAHIVVDNRTGHAIHANGCGQLFELALGSDSYPAQAGWPPCLTTLTIAVGKTSYPWTIRATYDECGGTGNPPLPACLPARWGSAPAPHWDVPRRVLPVQQYRLSSRSHSGASHAPVITSGGSSRRTIRKLGCVAHQAGRCAARQVEPGRGEPFTQGLQAFRRPDRSRWPGRARLPRRLVSRIPVPPGSRDLRC